MSFCIHKSVRLHGKSCWYTGSSPASLPQAGTKEDSKQEGKLFPPHQSCPSLPSAPDQSDLLNLNMGQLRDVQRKKYKYKRMFPYL